ncbi:TPA: hypothetical protein RG697_003081 [Morganella morganii]|uniref:hypothetical protein n=1 Tax=Morganella morganii TaxID=582 RepID=UPI001BD9F583|nr:hypothetical protein [Morganella morganii]MBT0379494.1 hypothetical protein [Morganella morganii subsp. morganii]HDU8611441.1 hypothetical protein [Morganella morganii]
MKKTYRIARILPGVLLLLLSGCDNGSAEAPENVPATEQAKSGNWQVKPETLTSGRAEDIKADLSQLNPVLNKSNEESIRLLNEIDKVRNDREKVKTILIENFKNQSDIEQNILSMTFKSAEVQIIRIQILSNIQLARKIYGIVGTSGFDIASPGDEFKQLSAKSFQMQQQIGRALDDLNQKHGQ